MTSSKRTLWIAAAAIVALLAVGRVLVATPGAETLAAPSEQDAPAAVETPAAEMSVLPITSTPRSVSYAIAVPELHGLPPQAAPGTELEIWVAWEPPVSKEPKIHRLLESVILEEISPPLLPDGPHVAMLLVPRHGLSDLLYGDRYGALSVAIPQGFQ